MHFFGHSKLPSSDLARIWDLADTKQAGHLDLQQFAVAMHLIDKRLAGEQIPNMLTNVNIGKFDLVSCKEAGTHKESSRYRSFPSSDWSTATSQ